VDGELHPPEEIMRTIQADDILIMEAKKLAINHTSASRVQAEIVDRMDYTGIVPDLCRRAPLGWAVHAGWPSTGNLIPGEGVEDVRGKETVIK
jgi:hypothetical protein